MKVFLGAIVAAALLGVGCAHNREASTQTETSGSSRASAQSAQQVPGYSCVVVDSGASGTSQSGAMGSQSQSGAVSGGAQQDQATGGSALGGGVSGGVQQNQDQATGGSSSSSGTVSGGAQQGGAIGGSAPGAGTTSGGSAPKTNTYDDTGMGGGGGGGG